MSLFKSLFKQTAIYGLATVLPRVLSFILVRVYTDKLPKEEFGVMSVVFSWMVVFNVVLAYGMETSFFRFYNAADDKKKVISTATMTLFWSSISFLAAALLFRNTLSLWSGVEVQYLTYAIWILVLDALVIIPFSKLRVFQRPVTYTIIKTGNVAVNLFLNIFFLVYLPDLAEQYADSFWSSIYFEGFQVGYIFVANLIASLLTLLVLLPDYIRLKWSFDIELWKKMMWYGLPVLVAGIAFSINESFDRILLEKLLPENTAKASVGAYSACYKLALFMTLFATAFRLGIEPFFFSYAKNEDASEVYARITKYFVIFGSVILLVVVVFLDILKIIMIPNASYWEAMKVVPLIILANFFLGIYHNLSVWYKLTDRTRIGAYISIVGAVITLVLNFILIERYSYVGSAVATLAAYGIMMLLSYRLGKRYYPIPYEMKKIGLYLISSVILSLVYFYRYRENYVIGGAFLAVFMYFVFRNEKTVILRILKK